MIGAVENIDPAKIKDLIEAHPEKKTLLVLLKGLQTAYHLKDQLHDLHFKGVEVDIKLGLSPKLNVAFLQ